MSDYSKSVVEGKTYLVTGASSGIGSSTAVTIAEQGGKVVLLARDEDRLSETAKKLKGLGHVCIPIDLTNHDLVNQEIASLANKVLFDGIVYSAGMHFAMPIHFTKLQDATRVMDINFHAAVNLVTSVLRNKALSSNSSLVFLSSVVASVGQPAVSLYAGSKGALEAFSKSLAMELAAQSVRVNCVAAGIVETPLSERLFNKMSAEQVSKIREMHPLGFGNPQSVADAVLFLLKNPWVTGSTVTVDGGYSAH